MLVDIKPTEKHEPDIQVDKDHVIRNYPIKEITFQDHHKKWQKIKFVGSVEETKDQLGEIFKVQHYKKGLIKKNMIIVDIGSNIGCTIMYFQPYAKKIYAIEPQPYCYYCLSENTKKFKNVETFNIGILNRNGDGWLTGGTENAPPQMMYKESKFVQPINVKRLDTFFEENKIDHVDLLKIDCEGAEYEIFMDSSFANVASKIDYIIGEAHNIPQMWPDLIPIILEKRGFKTKFLPFDNMFYYAIYKDKETGEETTYTYQQHTIFFAHR